MEVSPSGPKVPVLSFFLIHNGVTCCQQVGGSLQAPGQVPTAHLPRHFPLILFIQVCPQRVPAGLPDNCQPEVWTPSWWLSLFYEA